MALQQFQELNIVEKPNTQVEVIPIERYFGEMPLSKKEKEERIELAHKLDDVFLFLIALVLAYKNNGIPYDKPEIVRQVVVRYQAILSLYPQYQLITEDINTYVEEYVTNALDITLNHIDDAYYTSDDRALIIAEEETNSVFEQFAYAEAIKLGKKKKQWITMRDKRVRHTHTTLDGKTIKIKDTFNVGNSLMLFPRDTSYNASQREIANCRCVCKYI